MGSAWRDGIVTGANAWRLSPDAPDAHFVGEPPPPPRLTPEQRARDRARAARAKRERLEHQQAQRKRYGYVGDHALAHTIETYLVDKEHYTIARAKIIAQMAAPGPYNFQGNPRIAEIQGFSTRTAQRARADGEGDGHVVTRLLKRGEKLPAMRAAVNRPMLVRDTTPLRTRVALWCERRGKGRRYLEPRRAPRPDVAEQPAARRAVQPAEITPRHDNANPTGRRADPQRAPFVTLEAIEQAASGASDPEIADMLRELARGPPSRRDPQ